MGRQINSATAPVPDQYVQRLYKLMPAEITGAYVAISSLVINPNGSGGDWQLLAAFGFLLVMLPFYMWRVQSVTSPVQLVVSTISFPIWAANISIIPLLEDAHNYWHIDIPTSALGALLILWSTATPLFVK